jgi:hypothetical protein
MALLRALMQVGGPGKMPISFFHSSLDLISVILDLNLFQVGDSPYAIWL